MKPHIQRRSDFIGDNPIADHNDAGILVTRDGGTYKVAVEVDVDTVVQMGSTEDKDQAGALVKELVPCIHEIRERYSRCFPD
ncbi:hypothetical protein SY88_13085 [Clostridiales bacterium PH28_bin88]|nr:hypothetical protein SY88_13085 [Clostridiales bacterium PH28_bin88]